jgi:acetamidase/formamidase
LKRVSTTSVRRSRGRWAAIWNLNDLGEGTSVYFPVFQPGAQFFTGDPHQVQGNGEVSGTALEQSNTVTLQFILHKNGGLACRDTHALHLHGNRYRSQRGCQLALKDGLDFLRAEKGLSPADAMAFASLAVDLDIAESVDFTVLVMRAYRSFSSRACNPRSGTSRSWSVTKRSGKDSNQYRRQGANDKDQV